MLEHAAAPASGLAKAGLLPGGEALWLVVGLSVLAAGLFALARSGPIGAMRTMGRVILVAVVALGGWWLLDQVGRAERAAEHRALEQRAAELAARAVAPGSALACLDGIAGDEVEEACEKVIFASPENVAAAVSYVAAQFAVLAAASELTASGGAVTATRVGLGRALEADRFGIAAHVLSVRERCTPLRCPPLALLPDARRVLANMAEQRFERHVRTYAASWSQTGSAVASKGAPTEAPAAPASTASAAPAPAKPSNDIFFPSAASIPPVNIMTSDPPARDGERKASPAGSPPPRPSAGNTGSTARQQAAPLPITPNQP